MVSEVNPYEGAIRTEYFYKLKQDQGVSAELAALYRRTTASKQLEKYKAESGISGVRGSGKCTENIKVWVNRSKPVAVVTAVVTQRPI